jgi:hypothetical protein
MAEERHMHDSAENETTSVIDPASMTPPPIPPRFIGLNQFVTAQNALALNTQPVQPRNFRPSQFVSPGVASSLNPQPLPPGGGEGAAQLSADDEWCGTVPHFPPPPPGPWADIVRSALAFR